MILMLSRTQKFALNHRFSCEEFRLCWGNEKLEDGAARNSFCCTLKSPCKSNFQPSTYLLFSAAQQTFPSCVQAAHSNKLWNAALIAKLCCFSRSPHCLDGMLAHAAANVIYISKEPSSCIAHTFGPTIKHFRSRNSSHEIKLFACCLRFAVTWSIIIYQSNALLKIA